MIEVRCLHTLDEAVAFRDAIDTLNLASPRPDPFSCFAYYENHQAVAQRFSRGPEPATLWLLLAFRDGELIGYLALKRTFRKLLGVLLAKLDLLTAHIADRPHLVARAEHQADVTAAFYGYLLSRSEDWSLLELQQQDACSPLQQTPPEASRGLFRRSDWPNMANGTITLCWPSCAHYFAALIRCGDTPAAVRALLPYRAR